MPKGAKIPEQFVENRGRSGSYGIKPAGQKFSEKIRIDAGTPAGMKGPNISHFHINKGAEHIFDPLRWPYW